MLSYPRCHIKADISCLGSDGHVQSLSENYNMEVNDAQDRSSSFVWQTAKGFTLLNLLLNIT